jgi:hypothetical protein
MALVVKDRVKETTTTTGTGTITLAGASTGFQSFSVIGNGNTTYYTIAGQSTSEWEVGIGTYTSSGTTLARTTVLASSNSGSLVSFSAGTKDVFVTYPADYAAFVTNTVSSFSGGSTGLTPSSATTGAVSLAGTLAVANGGTGLTTAGTAGQVLTTNGSSLSYGSAVVSGTAVASTSGTTITFTSIPSWVKRITVMFNGVSTSGSSAVLVRIGTSSGIATSGYIGAGSAFTSGTPSVANSTAGFLVEPSPGSGSTAYGSCVINNLTSNTWVAAFNVAYGDAPYVGVGAGSVNLGATLDRVQLTTGNGTDTFDAGTINILYE